MVSYNNNSTPDDSLCVDGINFNINEPFLLIANKPIPKHGKVYFEFRIKSYTQKIGYRNIPIYAGLHKEPAFGVLNSDFCIGSLFYIEGKDFDIIEKHNKTADYTHSIPPHIYTKIPGATDVIGVAVDYDNNFVSFYNNGKLFYSFYPTLFNIKDESNFYFCIWGNIACDLKGAVNFGKNGLQYLPSGYSSLYGEYYRKQSTSVDIDGDIQVVDGYTYTHDKEDLDGLIWITNDIKGDGSISLLSKVANINDKQYTIPITTTTDYLKDGGTIFASLPIPVEQKIYFEFFVKEGICADNIIGIPISIGISNSKTSIQSKSIRMPLFHYLWHNYTYAEVLSNSETVYQIEDVDTSVYPEQGSVIGVSINLKDNEITVLVNKIPLYTFKAVNLDFSNQSTPSYFFIHDEGVYKNYITGSFNFGESIFKDDIPKDHISLYKYYNEFYLNYNNAEIIGDVNVISPIVEKNIYLHGSVSISEPITSEQLKFDYLGLNKLMKTYNTISDIENHQTPDKDLNFLNELIKSKNNGYFPDDIF